MFSRNNQDQIKALQAAVENIDTQIKATDGFVASLQETNNKNRRRRREIIEKIEKLRNEEL